MDEQAMAPVVASVNVDTAPVGMEEGSFTLDDVEMFDAYLADFGGMARSDKFGF